MAQPTSSDDQAVRRRLSHNNLRRKQWRRRLPRAERKRPRRSGNSAALTFGVLVEHPIFLSRSISRFNELLPASGVRASGAGPRGEVAKRRADVPGGRVRRRDAVTPQSTSEGRNPQWRRRLKAERRRRRRRGKLAAPRERGRNRVPFFVAIRDFGIYRSSVPSQI
jgi:hypothetical protein